jgi:toxin ParE1/3/4
MAQYRLAPPAQSDLAEILAASAIRWGRDASLRYALLLYEAMQTVALDPERPSSRKRNDLWKGLRSLHIRHIRPAIVKHPPHVLYYRIVSPGFVEIVRILHDRMDPSLHLNADDADDE